MKTEVLRGCYLTGMADVGFAEELTQRLKEGVSIRYWREEQNIPGSEDEQYRTSGVLNVLAFHCYDGIPKAGVHKGKRFI